VGLLTDEQADAIADQAKAADKPPATTTPPAAQEQPATIEKLPEGSWSGSNGWSIRVKDNTIYFHPGTLQDGVDGSLADADKTTNESRNEKVYDRYFSFSTCDSTMSVAYLIICKGYPNLMIMADNPWNVQLVIE
jgi:hypothetical protein